MAGTDLSSAPSRRRRFATTCWSVVQAAADPSEPGWRDALETLCRDYWYPIYAHFRRKGRDADAAGDLTQAFFTRLIEKNDLRVADESRGRFRSFLLAAAENFLANQHDYDTALKRGGGRAHLSLDLRDAEDRLAFEPADGSTAETEFERRWALSLLERVLDALRAEYAATERGELFEALCPFLPKHEGPSSYAELARRLKMTEAAVKVAVHRLRKRFGKLLRQEIAQTVGEPQEIDDEIRRLFAALSR